MKADFAEGDITPELGVLKIGWLKEIHADEVLDPLFVRIAVFDNGNDRIAFVQLDTLSIRWTQVMDIRNRLEKEYGFPGAHVMVSATHNHAGPAIASFGELHREEEYIEFMVGTVVETFGKALSGMTEVQLGFGHGYEHGITANRRMVMRDGTVKTYGAYTTEDGRHPGVEALYREGPIDPEIGVVAARDGNGRIIGCMVNFTCHPTDHGGDTKISAGYPGVLASELNKQGIPVCLYLNGACGNVHNADSTGMIKSLGYKEFGARLAEDVAGILEKSMDFRDHVEFRHSLTTIKLPFREPTEEEIKGTVKGAQRFIDPKLYDKRMPALVELIKERGFNHAEVQLLGLDDHLFIGIPSEFFVQLGLDIKEKAWPNRAYIVGHANGMVGYTPHREAFNRGGYETTFTGSSRLAAGAGEMLVDAALELLVEDPSTDYMRQP